MGATIMEKIPVTIGILTYNSEESLERCLESVKNFRDILIADGGSTDGTLAIAQQYGARVITQSQQGKPITDFALERNLLLDAAQEDWFFYLDSDEIASPEFIVDVATAVFNSMGPKVYQVRYQIVSEDLSVQYKTLIPYFQPRFFSTKIGARFIRKVHERITWDRKRFPAGMINGPWYVPLDDQLDFTVYREKVWHRLPIMVEEWEPSFIGLIQKGIWEPLVSSIKQVLKMILLRVRFSSKEIIPLKYEFYRLYSQWVIVQAVWKRYFRSTSS